MVSQIVPSWRMLRDDRWRRTVERTAVVTERPMYFCSAIDVVYVAYSWGWTSECCCALEPPSAFQHSAKESLFYIIQRRTWASKLQETKKWMIDYGWGCKQARRTCEWSSKRSHVNGRGIWVGFHFSSPCSNPVFERGSAIFSTGRSIEK